jgi:hypothetical protein
MRSMHTCTRHGPYVCQGGQKQDKVYAGRGRGGGGVHRTGAWGCGCRLQPPRSKRALCSAWLAAGFMDRNMALKQRKRPSSSGTTRFHAALACMAASASFSANSLRPASSPPPLPRLRRHPDKTPRQKHLRQRSFQLRAEALRGERSRWGTARAGNLQPCLLQLRWR